MQRIVADTAGIVRELLVHPGDRIAAGQEVALIELMKMQIPVEALVGGVVATVKVQVGDAVEKGAVLFEIE
jgi:acetyl-CoA carboxylase biotin carboxyl carrier protein